MNGWTLAKYVLAIAGAALVIGAERFGVRWIQYPGMGLIVVAFLLRFPQRRAMRREKPDA